MIFIAGLLVGWMLGAASVVLTYYLSGRREERRTADIRAAIKRGDDGWLEAQGLFKPPF